MLPGYRSGEISSGVYYESDGLDTYVDGAFFSSDVGVSKSKREYWDKVLKILDIQNPGEVRYWDDEQENVDAAQELGIQAHLYTGIDQLQGLIR